MASLYSSPLPTRRGSEISRKKKEKRMFLAADSEVDIEFLDLEIRKYCPKRIFDIIIINEIDAESQEAMSSIINTGRQYEDDSCVTFIKYPEVIALLDRFDYTILPEEIKPMIEQVLEDTKIYLSITKPDKIPVIKLAVLVKLKLIEVMIRHKRRELDKMARRKVLIEELDNLTKYDLKGKQMPLENIRRDTLKKSRIVLGNDWDHLDTESDVIFDDDIFNHVWFYALEGFYNAKALSLILSSKVPITAIIKIDKSDSYNYPGQDSIYTKFWTELDEFLFSHMRSETFENTMLMQFTIKSENNLDVFEDLLYTIKSISEIKFQHLNYIRHINVYEMDNVFNHLPLHCMHTYNKIMSNIPLELANEVVVLSSILEETCFQLDGGEFNDIYGLNDNLSRTSLIKSNVYCPDPSVFNGSTQPLRDTYSKPTPTTFQCYHRDVLSKILNMYKPFGKLVYDLSLNVLRCIQPFNLVELMEKPEEEVTHKHDINPDGRPLNKANTKAFNHFINLFIFCTFQHKDEEQKPYEKEKFTENLCTYDNVGFYNNLRPKLEEQTFQKSSNTFFDLLYNVNPMDFYWRECYTSFILMQEIYKAQRRFSYIDTTYCPETDRLLVQFSDWLDEFGLNTKVYDETLLTPVCLRDFCRYTANEVATWIKENPPLKYVRKNEEAEICKGARKLKRLDMFEEYRQLLETTDPFVKEVVSTVSAFPEKQNNEVTFDQMMDELENYPLNNKLKEEYSKQEYSKDFQAYDFGTKYFALRGAKTIFASHDNVKVTVENCKFIDESSKCSINLQYLNNNLIMHSSESFRNFYSFHWILDNETIIVFEIQKKNRKVSRTVDLETFEMDLGKQNIPVEKEKPKIDIDKIKVKNIDEEKLETLLKQVPKNNSADDRTPMDIYQGLYEAIEKNRPIYKVNKGYETLKMLNPIDEIPITTILQRVLHDAENNVNEENLGENRTKRFMPLRAPTANLSVVDSATFRVTLPNGIYLTCYPSQIKETLVEVKQEVLNQQIKALRNEEFRLFTREGYILIKKIDGSITILTSNGNKIDFEKPDSDKEEIRTSYLKPVHCKTVEDYRKKLNKLMKNSGRNDDSFYISRRGALETKRGYVVNKDIIKVLEHSKLPYLKSSLLNFDGTKTVLEGNKISQKRLFYTVSENDFCREEIYYERKDGFKCILKRSATKTIEYPDGSRITTTVTVANELVDGYVYITLYYKYEHPYYVTVSYAEGDLLQLVLDDVIIEKSKDNICTLKLNSESTMTVDTDNVKFEKKCSKCQLPFRCTFDISPFHNNYLEFSKQFVHIEDSYQKHFFVDYSGVCRINKHYLSGPLNAANCNHIAQNTYKQLFAVKQTMSGEEFLTENMVNSYKEKHLQKEYIEAVNKGKNHEILKFSYQYYRPFTDRLLTKSILTSSVTLTKYQQPKEQMLYYSTVKLLCEIINANKVQVLLSHLIEQFSVIDIGEETKKLVQWLANKKEEEANLKRQQSLEKQEQLLMEEEKKCKCVKDKKTFARKISQWREEYKKVRKLLTEMNIPLYFNSEFCQTIKKRR